MADTAAPEQATRAPRAAGSRPRGPRRDGEPRTERPRRERVDAPKNPDSLRVKADTRVKILAGAVAAKMRESGSVVVDAIGAPSVNQAVKSVIIARGYLEKDGMDIVLTAKTVPEVGPDAISISLAKNPDGRKAAEADAAEKAKGPEEPAKEPEGGPKEDGDAIVGSNGALRIAVGTKPQALAGACGQRGEGWGCVCDWGACGLVGGLGQPAESSPYNSRPGGQQGQDTSTSAALDCF